ncbi:hypothetical protein [Bacteroides hominis]|uniref:hypothetical protein n=1 Tax=Bacteroides hominis TaxID=2763023 RepID=UPI003D6CDABB
MMIELIGIVTDGDIRKAILYGELSIEKIVNKRPVTFQYGSNQRSIINKLLEKQHFIRKRWNICRFLFLGNSLEQYPNELVPSSLYQVPVT